MLAFEVNRGVPCSSVHKFPFVRFQTRNVGPLPSVKDSGAVDEKIAFVVNCFPASDIKDVNRPFAFVLLPDGFRNFVVKLAVFQEIVFVGELFKVLLYLWCLCVRGGPAGIGLEAICVGVGRNITGTSNTKECFRFVAVQKKKVLMTNPGYLFSYQVPAIASFFS